MRRTTLHYGVQGPDALLLFVALLLLGAFGLLAALAFHYLWLLFLLLGALGVSVLLLVSSFSYRTALRDHILKRCSLNGSETALDIGTGGGLLAIGLAKLGCYAVGVDIWASSDLLGNHPANVLLNAELEGVEVPLLTTHCLSLPFREGSFDVAVCSDMIHNIHRGQTMRNALSEMHRALRGKGKVAIADLNPFLGPGWAKRRWVEELRRAGFEKIEVGRFRLTVVVSGEKP